MLIIIVGRRRLSKDSRVKRLRLSIRRFMEQKTSEHVLLDTFVRYK